MNTKKVLQYTAYTVVCIFAVIGMIFTAVYFAMQFGLLNVKGSIKIRNQFFQTATTTAIKPSTPEQPCLDSKLKSCEWNETPEWATVKGGLSKDAALISRISQETGVDARMIAAVVTPEQTRFFTSNREVWKGYFEPLKVLISLSQFSLGVSGIKQDTAVAIEQYANDPTSQFYPGDGMSALIAYDATADHDKELYNRLTDEKNHYYQYLYTALYIKEIQMQWKRAGFDISHSPEAVVTLFNIGFTKSIPHADVRSGGASIEVGGKSYFYGQLGSNFYHSDELLNVFPK